MLENHNIEQDQIPRKSEDNPISPVNSDDSTTNFSNSNDSSNSDALDPVPFDKEDIEAGRHGTRSSSNIHRTITQFSEIDNDANASRRLSRALSGIDAPERYSLRSRRTSNTAPLPSMGAGKPYPAEFPDPEAYTVSFDGPDDPLIPTNWPFKKKIATCSIIGFQTACIAWASSIFSPAIPYVAEEFHIGRVVATLGVSLYVLGFATGPIIWAPLSELYGRRIVLLISGFGFMIFQFAVATAKDIQTIMLCRAFGGAIGAAPMVVVPAAFADVFNNEQRGRAITIFVMSTFCVPIVAPVAGSFIVASYLSWRWVEYISGMMGALSLVLVTCFYQESHHPIVLVQKAQEIKARTGNWMIHAAHDEFTLTLRDIVEKNFTRPLFMLVTEPILFFVSLYNAFVYGILYLMLSAYPVIFEEGYGMKGGVSELPYLGMATGMLIGGVFTFFMEGNYIKASRANGGKPVPEERLPPLYYGSFAFPIGIFWLFWTGNWPDKVHWMAPTASGVFTGFGLVSVFNASMNYLIDSYLIFAASAMAANTFLRSSFACAFPLFGVQMLHNMGVKWAGLLLALIGVALIPVPFFFHRYGAKIRAKSKFALDI